MSKTEKQEIGAWGEEQASLFLFRKGYEIIDRNYRVEKVGEIDIVAWHDKYHFGKTLCFIEVKTRGEEWRGEASAERATQGAKLPKFLRVALWYCRDRGINREKTPIQFEQVSVYTKGKDPAFKHDVIPID